MKDFRQLSVWEKAHRLTLAVYEATKPFPTDERYGLTSQIRRSCASIPANIAEGCGRAGDGEFRKFLQVAMGSATELDYHSCWRLISDIWPAKDTPRSIGGCSRSRACSHRLSGRSRQTERMEPVRV